MNCTSCKQGRLVPSFIEGQFRAHTCNSCEGNWILIEDYVSWKERNADYKFSDAIGFSEADAQDSKKAMLCPVSGLIMRKYKITAGNEHKLDYCAAVGGLWLDKGEWELLKNEGLAGSLNAVLTQTWQNSLKEKSTKEHFKDIYSEKFGEDDYAKVKAFREWLYSQENKSELRAYVMAQDPYSAEK